MSSGLSHNSVLAVMQDRDHMMWIGTRGGLNKYNSVDNVIYKHDLHDSLSLSNNHINCIFETESTGIWIGTARGLNHYDGVNDRFRQYLVAPDSSGLSNGYVKCLAEDRNGDLWIGTANGLNVWVLECDCFRRISLEDYPSISDNVIGLFLDVQNRMWIGTKGGLYVRENDEIVKIELYQDTESDGAPFEIRDIRQDIDGLLWLATEDHGIFSFRYAGGELSQVNHLHTGNSSLVSDHVRKIYADDKNIWLGTLSGLSIYDKSTNSFSNFVHSTDKPEGISNSSIHDIYKDLDGGIWLATYTGGVNYYHPQNNLFSHVKYVAGSSNGLSNNSIAVFQEDIEGNLWIGTGGGLNCYDQKKDHFNRPLTTAEGRLSSNNVKALAADKNGNLWIGTYDGLNFYKPRTGDLERYLQDPGNNNSLNQNQVHALHLDKKGILWIGMNGGIFQTYDPARKLFYNHPELGSIVNTIFEDRIGRIWIGARSGLRCVDGETGTLIDISKLTVPFFEELIDINWIGEDSSGNIWIGTQSSGLIIFYQETGYRFDKTNGLSDNTVNAILEDAYGDFWISTNKGISKITLNEDSRANPQIKSTDFTSIHGLQGAQFEPGSAIRSSTGRLYFGGINGYNSFLPKEIEKIDYFPPVNISELRVDFKKNVSFPVNSLLPRPVHDGEKLILRYSERNLFLRFAGINFVNPDETYYRYMLSGFDNQWIDLGKQRSINFTFLPVGEHELRIKSSTNPEIWEDPYTRLLIHVQAPWWLTWWAFILYAFILSVLLYLFFSYSQRWARLKSKLQMEQFEREKEMELHESKLKFFTDVSHELRTPLTLILAPLENILLQSGLSEKLGKQLSLIQKNGIRMMRLIDQVLNLRKLETGHDNLLAAKGDIIAFLKEITLSFSEIASSRNIDFEYLHEMQNLDLWFDRNKMEIIVFNLLSNAFKHAPSGGRVSLSVHLNAGRKSPGRYAEISVFDNGKGISKGDLEHIFERFYSKKIDQTDANSTGVGLELAKRMVELHKGKIEVESRLKTASEYGYSKFKVSIPLGKDHLSENEIISGFKDSEDASQYTSTLLRKEKTGSLLPVDTAIEFPELADKDKQTLLLVEDNSEVRKFIRDLFREHYKVEEAENGVIGWEIASKTIPDLVISDIMMPEMDGIELCRKLKSDLRTSHIPVILLTARTAVTFKYEGLEHGADDYITKPFSAQFLLLRVQNLIQQRTILRNHFQRMAILEPEYIAVTSVDEQLLKKAVDYVNQNIENTSISVEELSLELGLSRGHLYRKIKALTNLTVVDFIRSIRLKKAAMLLEQGKLTIKEVQNRVGFEQADYFRKCFKSQYGMTPSEYSRRNAHL